MSRKIEFLAAFYMCILLAIASLLLIHGEHNVDSLNATSGSDYKVFQSPEHGIVVQYPSDWGIIRHLYPDGAIIEFISSPESNSDMFTENVEILINDLQNVSTLDDYARQSNRLLNATFVGYNVTESEPTTLSGNPAHKKVFSVRQPFVDLQMMQIFTITDNKGYALTYTAEKDKYNSYLPIAQKMVDSFEIMDTPTGNKTVGPTTGNMTFSE